LAIRRISTPRSEETQSNLWNWVGDREIPSYATARTYIGDFFEEATKHLFGGERLKTQAYRLCPDLQADDGNYLEVKSVGSNNSSLVYDHRVEKYKEFMAQGYDLFYVFWHHNVKVGGLKTLVALQRALAAGISHVTIVDALIVHKALESAPSRFTNHSSEHRKAGPWKLKPARTITSKMLRSWATGQPELCFIENVYGHKIPSIPVYGL